MSSTVSFKDLGLYPDIVSTLKSLGYDKPTPVQYKSIAVLMEGRDLLAQAQTGTGKTAAFAIPAIATLDVTLCKPQVLVVAPTRELAIQVSEAFQRYARHLKGFFVTSVCGGNDMQAQLKRLKKGVHVVVGTPGRVMDHLRRGTLKVDALKMVILDEADEMLKRGFVDDVEWILSKIPRQHQVALFSATIPPLIQKIARRYQKNAVRIKIEGKEVSLTNITQHYIQIPYRQKIDVLLKFLAVEHVSAAIIFTRTKVDSTEVAQKLHSRGYAVAALNGDMKQALRQKAVKQLKDGQLDIIVATDVAARGIDIERISHVINYDIPSDAETYLHRIGRTGRAGRKGNALLLVTPGEQRALKNIEACIRKKITRVEPPSTEALNAKRDELFAEKVVNVLKKSKRLKSHYQLINRIMAETGYTAEDIAAATSYLLSND